MDQDVTINQINIIAKQFLCTFPLINFNWQNILNTFLSEDLQACLLNKTINMPLVLRYPVQINYQKLFLKYILDKLETLQSATTSIEESVIHDDLYSAYGRLVALGTGSAENYKHYSIETGNKVITLKESNSLISDGTTGLRTWQAALALSEWIIQNKDTFRNQTVLELGSGVGLTGLVLNNLHLLNTLYLTDCHEAVLKTLCDNVRLNVEEMSHDKEFSKERKPHPEWNELRNRCLFTHTNTSTTLSVLDLPWDKVTRSICGELGAIDKVIAADIIYDKDLFKSLISAMKCLKEHCRVKEFIFACTERNPETLDEFLKLVSCTFQKIEHLPIPPQNNFLWSTDTPVKIYRFKD